MCNGVDDAQVVYDNNPAIGIDDWVIRPLVDTSLVGIKFVGCVQYKGRMYYWKDNDNAFYYAQAGSYEGTLQKFDLGSLVKRGGKLVMIGTWSQQDSGDGKDDFIFFVFSTGELLLYQGDDPETTGYWEMVGRYAMAEPLSPRGVIGFGSDTIIMTRDGYVNLATIIQQGETSDVNQFSHLIYDAVKERTRFNYGLFGWDVELVQKDGLMVFNVPLSEESYEQHVLNTVTMKWCRFTDMNVCCVTTHEDKFYGGGNDGVVYGLLEGVSDLGAPIYYTALYAYNHLGSPGLQKHVTAAQIISTHSQPQFFQLTGQADYDLPVLGTVPVPTGLDIGAWSVNPDGYIDPASPPDPDPSEWPVPAVALGSFWDEDSWAAEGTRVTTKGWQNVSAFGYAVSLLVRFAKYDESVEWRSTNLRYHIAGAQ
jgi:hypothetical protein